MADGVAQLSHDEQVRLVLELHAEVIQLMEENTRLREENAGLKKTHCGTGLRGQGVESHRNPWGHPFETPSSHWT